MIGVVKKLVHRLWKRGQSPRFANVPEDLTVIQPVSFRRPERITIGSGVYIGQNSIVGAIVRTGPITTHPDGGHVAQEFDSRIVIGNRVAAIAGLQVLAHQCITIGDDVMLANNVFLCDALHGYEHARFPYKYQGMFRIQPIKIGRGCWVGQNVVVMPGVTVGEMSIIGANSVVTRNIPSYSIAVGAPARVIKKWDDTAGDWVSVDGSAGNGKMTT